MVSATGFERMQLTRGDTQHPHRLAHQDRRQRRRSWPIPAATQPARPILCLPPPVPAFGTEKQLTAPADRSVREARTPLPSLPPWLSVAPSRPIAEPPWRVPSPAPATATVPDPRPRLTPGTTLRWRRRLCRRGASPTTIRCGPPPRVRWHAGPDIRRTVGGGLMGRTQIRPYSGPKKRTGRRCLFTVPTLSIAETCRKWRCK